MFEGTALRGKTTVVSSYDPVNGASIQDAHSTDAENNEETFKYNMAKKMMGTRSALEHEEWAKQQFIDNPGSMKLVIVVNKLLTGFDAPKATFLYIDKHMEDHDLFQAICRVNRVESERKEFGYIIDYKDLFNEIKSAVEDYTNGAFSGYEKKDVEGLLKNRLEQGKKDLDEALEKLDGISQNVKYPKDKDDYFDYFVYPADTPTELQQAVSLENANKREKFYDAVLTLVNRYLAIATQMIEAGYTQEQAIEMHKIVSFYDDMSKAIMLRSGDTTDLKQFNAMMRQLLDQYVQAPASKVLGKLTDFSFLEIIDATKSDDEIVNDILGDEQIVGGQPAAAETISAQGRKYIVRKRDSNPDFYDKLSEKLNELLEEIRNNTREYREVLKDIIQLMKQLHGSNTNYPSAINTDGKKALYDNLGQDEDLAIRAYNEIRSHAEVGFRENRARLRALKMYIQNIDGIAEDKVETILNIVIHNPEFWCR